MFIKNYNYLKSAWGDTSLACNSKLMRHRYSSGPYLINMFLATLDSMRSQLFSCSYLRRA